MSSSFNVYVGVFMKLPEDFNWLSFSVKYNIDENDFTEISADDSNFYLIPNQDTTLCESYDNNSDNEVMEINANDIKETIKKFKVLSKVIRNKIEKEYNEKVQVMYGVVPYYS